jgi:hypothetical protein
MIDRKQLEELDTLRVKGIRPLDTYEIGSLFMTLRASFKVVEAAEDYYTFPSAHYRAKLKKALAAFYEGGEKERL